MTELVEAIEIRTRSPYRQRFNKLILPIIRENIERIDEVILREKDVRELLNFDDKIQTLSIYARLKKLAAPEYDVSMGYHMDNTRIFSFYKKVPK